MRSVSVWMGFALLTGLVRFAPKPKTRAGWRRFFAFAACGAVEALWTAQMIPLSLGDASPVTFGEGTTAAGVIGGGVIRAIANIDRTDPPKLPSFH